MATFFSPDDCKELFAEKIAEKVLPKFKGDSFQMDLSDVTKTSVKNIATMLRCADVTIEFMVGYYSTAFRVSTYSYESFHNIGFLNASYNEVGRIEIRQNYDDTISTTFVAVNITEAMPLFKEIVLQLLANQFIT